MVLTQLSQKIFQAKIFFVFPYHYGSHATREGRWHRKDIPYVSIPLWFSRNASHGEYDDLLENMFPYHYGSHATVGCPVEASTKLNRFHTTMVLTQRNISGPSAWDWIEFPYHYGSHATVFLIGLLVVNHSFHTTMVLTQLGSFEELLLFISSVSIPLWFSRNV